MGEEKALKSLKKECSAESKKLKRLLIDIEFQEGRFQKLVSMIRRFEQRLFDAKDQAADEEDKLNAILSKEDEYIKWKWLKKVKRLWSKFKQ
jgi:septal ring factor EnvC (AmiA/AmiB activator)|tara:strand:+ start:183 stop:458 length:276 start_codon:yes stop_codon:yes gene_type:complete